MTWINYEVPNQNRLVALLEDKDESNQYWFADFQIFAFHINAY